MWYVSDVVIVHFEDVCAWISEVEELDPLELVYFLEVILQVRCYAVVCEGEGRVVIDDRVVDLCSLIR